MEPLEINMNWELTTMIRKPAEVSLPLLTMPGFLLNPNCQWHSKPSLIAMLFIDMLPLL
jgi:hypothetical protein